MPRYDELTTRIVNVGVPEAVHDDFERDCKSLLMVKRTVLTQLLRWFHTLDDSFKKELMGVPSHPEDGPRIRRMVMERIIAEENNPALRNIAQVDTRHANPISESQERPRTSGRKRH